MARTPIGGGIYADDTLEHGIVLVTRRYGAMEWVMTIETFRAVSPVSDRLYDAIGDMEGTFRIPRSVLEPDAAADLRLSLSFTEPVETSNCIYVPCLQDATELHRDGFHLCLEHASLMSDWDDLLAV